MDFELKNGKLWLVYAVKGGDKIEITDTGGKHITQLVLNYHFHKDSIGQAAYGFLYSTYKDSLQIYSLDEDKIVIKRMSLDTYNQYSGTLVAFKFPFYYYVNYDSTGGTRVNYSYFNKSTNTRKIFYKYNDSKLQRANRETEEAIFALQLLLSDQKVGVENRNDTLISQLGYRPDALTGKELLKDIYVPQGASTAEIENTYASAQQLLAMSPDPSAADNEAITLKGMLMHVFSILRIVNDSVYIFNFNNNILSVYSPSNEYVRQVPFGVSTRAIKYRKKSILVDEEKQECYFKYKRWGYTYLQKINLATGNISYTIKLKYPFIDKVCVSDGYAYFCYFNTQDRDNIYNGKTCLYKQKLD